MATYLTGGVSSTGSSGSSGGGLAGLITGAGQLAGLTLQGLANYYTPQATVPVYTGSAQTNALPNSGASVIYNTPTQNNYSSRLNNINVSQPQDPFATQGLTSVPNMLHGNADFMTMDNATRSNSPMQSIDNLTGSATDQADPQGVGQIAPGIAPTSTNTNPGGIPAGFNQGPAPSAAPALSLADENAQLRSRNAELERAKEAALDRARQNYDAPNNVQPGYVAPQVSPPYAPAPSAAQAPAANQAPGFWQQAGRKILQGARSYQFAHHPQYASMMINANNIQNQREIAAYNARAAYEAEMRKYDHEDQAARTKLEGEHRNKMEEMAYGRDTELQKAAVANRLTEAQKLNNYSTFFAQPPGSDQRKQMAMILPELAKDINAPQDLAAAADLNSKATAAQKAAVDLQFTTATYGIKVATAFNEYQAGKISLQEMLATLESKIGLAAANTSIANTKAFVASQTAGAQINSAEQQAWKAGVENQYLPGQLAGQAALRSAQTAESIGNAALGMGPAPKGDANAAAQRAAIQAGIGNLAARAAGGQVGQVPPPPPMAAPTGQPYGMPNMPMQIPPANPNPPGNYFVPPPPVYQLGVSKNNAATPASFNPAQPPAPSVPQAPPMGQMPQTPQPGPQPLGAFVPPRPANFNQAAQNVINQLPPALKPLGVALAGTMAGLGDGLTNGPLTQQAQRRQAARAELMKRLPQVQPEVIQGRNTLPQLPPQEDFPSGPFGQVMPNERR